MSDTTASLRRKLDSAGDLQSVVRTMKAMAAASIGQYERAMLALDDYYRTVQWGLSACLRQNAPLRAALAPGRREPAAIRAMVFGSDQGLVGQFNEVMAQCVVSTLTPLAGEITVCPVGERMQAHLQQTPWRLGRSFVLPGSIAAITLLVGEVLADIDTRLEAGASDEVYLFYQRPATGSVYTPVSQRLLPLDDTWMQALVRMPWPARQLPQVLNDPGKSLQAMISEYLFVSVFRACAQSLASENAARLAAMQRAEKNIDELRDSLSRDYNQLRQSNIDEELFDVISGFEALNKGA